MALSTRSATVQCRRCLHQALSGRTLFSSSSVATSRLTAPTAARQSATPLRTQTRCLHATSSLLKSSAPKTTDRGPASKEDTQTDFNAMDILSNTPAPTTAVDSCMADGFALNSGLKVTGSGVLLVSGEAFKWRPWVRGDGQEGVNKGKVHNAKGQFDVDKEVWGLLDLVWPKPDLLVLGTGKSIAPVSPQTRQHLNDLGIRLEVQDTRNAAAQYNMLATERGVHQVMAALVPIGWRDTK